MTKPEHFFLVVSDRRSGESSVEELGVDPDAAMEVYRAREHALRYGDSEVVLLGASSLEALRRTHSSYFGASGALGSSLRVVDDQ